MVAATLLGAAFSLAMYTRADADLWGHLRFGLDIIDTQEIPLVDPYSFNQDKPWISHEWLSELQMATAYLAAGTTGLIALKAALVCLVLALVWRAWRLATFLVRLGVMLILVVGTVHMTSSVRPQTWTFVCLGLLCSTLMSDGVKGRWWLPALFTFWANCHGGWVVGFGVLAAWTAAEVLTDRNGWRKRAALVTACALATLIHPSGIWLWQFLGSTVRLTRDIDEWQPLWGLPVLSWLPWGLAVAGTAWSWRHAGRRRLPIATTLAMLAYASARVQRIESLFVVAAAIMLAPTVTARWPHRRDHDWWAVGLARAVALGALIPVVLVSALTARQAASCLPILGPWAPDTLAMTALGHAGAGRIVTPFNWGQYAIWHLGPRLRVSMDGRREAIYTDDRLREHDAVMAGTAEGLAVLGRWRPEYAWLPSTSASTAAWLLERGYRLDVKTDMSMVLVRGDIPPLPQPQIGGRNLGCFPG